MSSSHNLNVRLPERVSSFPEIRQNDQIYVDKTECIYEIADSHGFYYFLNPEGFGKSLLVSTIKSLFEDGLKYFHGLAIEKLWDESDEHNRDCTVLHLDFSEISHFATAEEFKTRLSQKLERFMMEHPCGNEPQFLLSSSVIGRFDYWLERRVKCKLGKLVLLVDAYDAPLNRCWDDPRLYGEIRNILLGFFATVKSRNGAWRLMLVTGNYRYPFQELEPSLNYLSDLSAHHEFAALTGFTEEEIRRYFSPYVERAAATLGIGYEECLSRMKAWYGGYCFDDYSFVQVFNPWSVLNFLANPEKGFEKYWYDSGGSPLDLQRYLNGDILTDPERYGADHWAYDLDWDSYKGLGDFVDRAMLTLTGYLTLSQDQQGYAVLNYPNLEVATAMAGLYADRYLSREQLHDFAALFQKFDGDGFLQRLNAFIAELDQELFPLQQEQSLQSLLSLCIMSANRWSGFVVDRFAGSEIPKFRVGNRHFAIAVKYVGEGKDPEALLADAVNALREIRDGEYNGDNCRRIFLALVFSGKDRAFTRFKAL